MKKLFIVVLLIVGLLIPSVSAEILYDETLETYEFTGGQSTFSATYEDHQSDKSGLNFLVFRQIQDCNDVSYIVIESPRMSGVTDWCTLSPGSHAMEYTVGTHTGTGTINVFKSKNVLGQITNTRVTIFFDDWDIGTMTGQHRVTLNRTIGYYQRLWFASQTETGNSPVVSVTNAWDFPYTITASCGRHFKNDIKIEEFDDGNSIRVILNRNFGGKAFASVLDVYDSESQIIYSDASSEDLNAVFLANSVSKITVSVGTKSWEYPLSTTSPTTSPTVTVYVKNSQNNALIADAHIVINASVNEEFYEVVNETLPGGIYTGNLQPTGGGLPNPDFYRLIATAEGYNSIMPYIDFEVDGDTTIYAILDPIGGAPEDENNTFIDFYVRDINANPIAGATVNFGGYTLYTNSAGYTIFEMEKNSTYSWTVSKLGYGSVTGNAVIGSNARYTINAVMAPEVTPTTPTPKPSVTPVSPTPTLTAPTGEPVSNWLEWFAAHFGMILGGGVEIGKIFMWLCFTVPVGVYVGNKAKAGAAGFMAGAGIVTLFFVLIGWVPIWLVVLLALLIGLLYAKVYSNTDNGGGR